MRVSNEVKLQVDTVNDSIDFYKPGKSIVYCEDQSGGRLYVNLYRPEDELEFGLVAREEDATLIDNTKCAYYMNTLMDDYDVVGKRAVEND